MYVEEQDSEGGGGAVMVSAVVRAPPVDVFKVNKGFGNSQIHASILMIFYLFTLTFVAMLLVSICGCGYINKQYY